MRKVYLMLLVTAMPWSSFCVDSVGSLYDYLQGGAVSPPRDAKAYHDTLYSRMFSSSVQTHLATVADHSCDKVVVVDDTSGPCTPTAECRLYEATKFDGTLFGREYYFCQGYTSDGSAYGLPSPIPSATASVRKAVYRVTPYVVLDSVYFDAQYSSLYAGNFLTTLSSEDGSWKRLVPGLCLTRKHISEWRNGHAGNGVYSYTLDTAYAQNCTKEMSDAIRDYLLQYTTEQIDDVSRLLTLIDVPVVAETNIPLAYPTFIRPCVPRGNHFKIDSHYAIENSTASIIVYNNGAVNKDPKMVAPVRYCTHAGYESGVITVPLIWRSHSWYEEMLLVILGALKEFLVDIVEPIITKTLQVLFRVLYTVCSPVFGIVRDLILDDATTMVVVSVLSFFAAWYLYRRVVKLTSPGINVNIELEKRIDGLKFY